MTHGCSRSAYARLLQVGVELVPVYGDDQSGWSVEVADLLPHVPLGFRYESLDELFFALVNMNISEEGVA